MKKSPFRYSITITNVNLSKRQHKLLIDLNVDQPVIFALSERVPVISREDKLLLSKLIVHLREYLLWERLIRTNRVSGYSTLTKIIRDYRLAEAYLFDQYEHCEIFDCEYACRLVGLKQSQLIDWLKNISLKEITSALDKLKIKT